MIRAKVTTSLDAQGLRKKAQQGSITSLGHAGAAIRLQARHSIRKGKKPSAKETPPHTRKGRLRNAIKYALTAGKQSVVIGPDYDVAADSGSAHEFGGKFRRERYDKRPYMGPALEKIQPRLPSFWAGSVKG